MTNARTTYRENEVRGASPVRLVVLLYEQLIHDLTQAAQAIDQNEIERRTRLINHAVLVVGYLQSALDFANGGKAAQDLDHFYKILRKSLVQLQFFPSKAGLTQQIVDLLAIREAWIQVERAENPSATPAAVAAPPDTLPSGPAASESATGRAHMDWNG